MRLTNQLRESDGEFLVRPWRREQVEITIQEVLLSEILRSSHSHALDT